MFRLLIEAIFLSDAEKFYRPLFVHTQNNLRTNIGSRMIRWKGYSEATFNVWILESEIPNSIDTDVLKNLHSYIS